VNPLAVKWLAGAAGLLLLLALAVWGAVDFAKSQQAAGAAKVEAAQAKTDMREADRRALAVSEVAYDAQLQSDASRAAADRADRARDALRLQLAAYVKANSRHADPAASAASEAADDAIGVRWRLFSESDARSGELAKALDASYAAGVACERSYDALTP